MYMYNIDLGRSRHSKSVSIITFISLCSELSSFPLDLKAGTMYHSSLNTEHLAQCVTIFPKLIAINSNSSESPWLTIKNHGKINLKKLYHTNQGHKCWL